MAHAIAGVTQSIMHGGSQELPRSEDERTEVGRSLAAVGAALDKAFKGTLVVKTRAYLTKGCSRLRRKLGNLPL